MCVCVCISFIYTNLLLRVTSFCEAIVTNWLSNYKLTNLKNVNLDLHQLWRRISKDFGNFAFNFFWICLTWNNQLGYIYASIKLLYRNKANILGLFFFILDGKFFDILRCLLENWVFTVDFMLFHDGNYFIWFKFWFELSSFIWNISLEIKH